MPNLPPIHRPRHLGLRKDAERKRQRDLRQRRGSLLETKAWWQKQRKWFITQNPLCVCCKANGTVKATEIVDHIVPHKEDLTLFSDPENWQALCRWCHEHVKKPLENLFAKGKVTPEGLRLDREFPEHFGGF